MPTAAPTKSGRCARNAADLDAMTFRQRVMVDVSKCRSRPRCWARPVSMPLAIGPTGLAGLFHADGEILGGAGRRGLRHSVLHEHHVDLLDRGRPRGDRPAVLVSAIPHEGSRIQSGAHRSSAAAQCSALMLTLDLQVLGGAPPRSAQRPDDSAAPHAAQCLGRGDATRPGRSRCCSASGALSAIWSGRIGGTSGIRTLAEWTATQFDRVRELARRGMGEKPLARKADPQGRARRRGCALRARRGSGRHRRLESRRPAARRRALVDLGAARRSSRPSTAAAKSCSTAASAPARTSRRPWRLGARGTLIGKSFLYRAGGRRRGGRHQGARRSCAMNCG